MKKFVLGSLALAAMLATPAMAADMPIRKAPPPVPIYDWSGFYVGAHAGWLWGETSDWRYVDGTIDHDFSAHHLTLGLHFGAQLQFAPGPWGAFLIGVEASLSGPTRNNRDREDFHHCAIDPTHHCGIYKFDDIATVGGRFGLAFDRFLVTVSGGYARAEIHTREYFSPPNPAEFVAFSSANTHHGWYVGGALEFMVHKGPFVDVIVGVDYQHIELDEARHRDADHVGGLLVEPKCIPTGSFCKDLDGTIDTVRARLTIKTPGFGFLWPVARP